MYCKKCKKEYLNGTFCTNCGEKLVEFDEEEFNMDEDEFED